MSTITLTTDQANQIADALLAGCLFTARAEDGTPPQSLEEASARNTCQCLRDAMLLLEGRIAQPEPARA